MAEKPTFDDRSHDSGIRNAEHGTGSDAHEIEQPHERHIDPAEEVMSTNPNLSPPIHPRRN